MTNRAANGWLWLILLVVIAFAVRTLPAHAAELPTPPKTEKPVVLKIYPKLLPPQEGEEIIRRPGFDPHEPPPEDIYERGKDPRTWAYSEVSSAGLISRA